MSKKTKSAIESLKKHVNEITQGFTPEESEEFYNEISEWAYGRYEHALICQGPEMQDYEAEDYPGIL
ncbi:MAG: hypothetical protein HDR92_05155 [Bacteroides sp.]|nr:hypothetical protein [Bacteroides sp.]